MEEPAIRQGVYVTAGYVLVFYACLIRQASAKWEVSASYKARGERVSFRPLLACLRCLYFRVEAHVVAVQSTAVALWSL